MSINRGMTKKIWYIDASKYYLTIKTEIGSMDLESVIQSEVRKRKMSCIKAHMWNLEKWYR